MRYMKRLLILVFVLLCGISFAQNDPLITNYMFTPITMNPAFAGQKKATNALLLVREQWVGFDEAPSTQLINFDTQVKKLGGIGFSIMNDKLGFEQSLSFNLIYSKKITLSDVSSFSIGGAFGMINKSLSGSKLRYDVPIDNKGIFNDQSKFAPNFDLGLLYTLKGLRLGVSSTHLINSKSSSTIFNVPRHIYGFADYIINTSDRLKVIPSILFKNSPVRTQVECSIYALLDDKFWGGISYRNQDAASLLLGLTFLKNYSVGYSYDANIGSIKSYSSGSHEIFVRYNMVKAEKPYKFYKSPRYFN